MRSRCSTDVPETCRRGSRPARADPLAHGHVLRQQHQLAQQQRRILLGDAGERDQVSEGSLEGRRTADDLGGLPVQFLHAPRQLPHDHLDVVQDDGRGRSAGRGGMHAVLLSCALPGRRPDTTRDFAQLACGRLGRLPAFEGHALGVVAEDLDGREGEVDAVAPPGVQACLDRRGADPLAQRVTALRRFAEAVRAELVLSPAADVEVIFADVDAEEGTRELLHVATLRRIMKAS